MLHTIAIHFLFISSSPVSAMDSESDSPSRYGRDGKVMLASALLLFLILLIIIFLHAYGYPCFRRRRHYQHHSRHHQFPTSTAIQNKGLDPSLLKFLPIFTYSSAVHRPLHHHCAVCLSEFRDQYQLRLLPNCNHAFHTLCVDTWFQSHITCPLCRAPVHRPPPLPEPASLLDHYEPGTGCSSPKAIVEVMGLGLGLGSAGHGEPGLKSSDLQDVR